MEMQPPTRPTRRRDEFQGLRPAVLLAVGLALITSSVAAGMLTLWMFSISAAGGFGADATGVVAAIIVWTGFWVGLSLGLGRFSFDLHHSGPPVGDPARRLPTISFNDGLDDDPAAWQFAQWEPTPHHAMAAAIRRGARADLQINLREVVPGLDEA